MAHSLNKTMPKTVWKNLLWLQRYDHFRASCERGRRLVWGLKAKMRHSIKFHRLTTHIPFVAWWSYLEGIYHTCRWCSQCKEMTSLVQRQRFSRCEQSTNQLQKKNVLMTHATIGACILSSSYTGKSTNITQCLWQVVRDIPLQLEKDITDPGNRQRRAVESP